MRYLFIFILFTGFVIAETTIINSTESTNQIYQLNASSCIFDNVSNNTYCGKLSKISQTITLNYSDSCYKLTDPVAFGYCMQAHPANLSYSNSDLELFVNAPPFPYINQTIFLTPSSINDSFWVIYGLNISVNGSTFVNYTVNVTVNQTVYVNQTIDHNVTIEVCSGVILNTSVNETCNTTVVVPIGSGLEGSMVLCVDRLNKFCTPNEILMGDMPGCFSRYIKDMNNSFVQNSLELDKTKQSLQFCESGSIYKEQVRKDNEDVVRFLVIMVFVALAIPTLGVFLVKRAQKVQTQEHYEKKKV